jgi:hypothetical protein
MSCILSGAAYFDAIEAYGVYKIVKADSENEWNVKFLGTHITACAKERRTWLFRELIQIISGNRDTYKRFAASRDDLDKIIHMRIKYGT